MESEVVAALHDLQRTLARAAVSAKTPDRLAYARLVEYAEDVSRSVGDLVEGFIRDMRQLP